MIYTKKTIQDKRKNLRSKKARARTSVSLIILKIILVLCLIFFVCIGGFLYGSFRGILSSTPATYNLKPKYSATIIYDDKGKKTQVLSDYSSNRIIVEYEQLPDNLKNAFIAIEDERFYEHNGVDLKGIIRALVNDITHMSSNQGASTITQQLIKNNVFNVGGEDNLIAKIKRKVQEQALALKVEQENSKEEILTNYLNTINLGKGTLGVEAASQYYFNKSVEKLTLSECAVLAGITKNPTYLNPIDYPEDNNTRRDVILKKMYELNYISTEEYEEALADNVYARISDNNTHKHQKNEVYSYFTDALITQIVEDLQEQKGYSQATAYNLVYRGGLRIHSTQSTTLQKAADSIINDPDNYPVETKYSLDYSLEIEHSDKTTDTYTQNDVKKYFQKKNKDKDYSTVYSSKKELKKAASTFRKHIVKKDDTVIQENVYYTLQPQVSYSLINQKTGAVKVLVGGRGTKNHDLALNRAVSFERQPGSTFKILSTYAPALDNGGMTLATVFDDAPYRYENGDRVTNFKKNSYGGLTTIRDAIIDSNNIVPVKALTELEPQVGYNYLLNLGFTTLVKDRVNTSGELESDVNQALSLGGITDGVDNLELTAAYASIANKGVYNKPILYTKVTDSNGEVILENKKESRRVMKETTAWLLTDAMEDVVKKGTGVEAQLSSDMAVAGKTGTTSNNYDYWFCGYTPYYTASIWTGYDYNTSFENKDDYHKVIWAKIMNRIIDKKDQKIKDFDKCDDIETATICAKSGKLAVEHVCSKDPEKSMERTEYFASGTVPESTCDSHIAVTFCSKSKRIAGKYCPKKTQSTKVFRIRPKGSTGTTADTPYTVYFDLKNYACDVHTKEWYEHKLMLKKEKELEKLFPGGGTTPTNPVTKPNTTP